MGSSLREAVLCILGDRASVSIPERFGWKAKQDPNNCYRLVHSAGFNLLTPLGPCRSFPCKEWWPASWGVRFGLQLGGQHISSPITNAWRDIYNAPYVDRYEMSHFFWSMVVARPHVLRYTAERMEAGAILVQLGRGIQQMQVFDCSAFFIGHKIDWVSRRERSALLPCTNLVLNKAGWNASASGTEQHAQYLWGESCVPVHWRACSLHVRLYILEKQNISG